MSNSKSYDRHVNIWVNGKEVKNDVSSIRKEMLQLTNQQAKMTIGSKEYVETGKQIGKLKGIMNEHRESVKATGSGWDLLGGTASKAVSKISAALKALLANPVVFFLAAIVGAVSLLIKAFKSTDAGATEFAARFEQIKAILDVVRQRLVNVTGAIGHVFKGEWKQAAASMKEAFTGIGDQIKYATQAAYEYQYALDRIQDAESNYVSQAAENRNKIARLEYTAQDRSRSTEERRKALQEALAISQEEVERNKEFSKQKLDAEMNYLAEKAGLRGEDVLSFIRMTDAEQANASQALQTLRNNNEEKFAEIEKLYAAWIDADTKFYEENKRNLSRMTGFEEELRNEAEAAEKKRHDEILKRRTEKEKAGVDEMKRLADQFKEEQKIRDDFEKYQKDVAKQRREEREKAGVEEFKRLEEQHRRIEELEQVHADAKWKIAASSTDLLAAVAGKNKALQKASLVADRALAIAQIIIQNKKANAALRGSAAAIPAPFNIVAMALAQAAIIKNNIAAGIDIAAVVAATATGLGSFASGGYTKKGSKFEPAGIVHAGEWVANREMVASPQTGQIIQALETQRVNGSYASGGYVSESGPGQSGSGLFGSDPELKSLIKENIRINKMLLTKGVKNVWGYKDIDNMRQGMGKLDDIEGEVSR